MRSTLPSVWLIASMVVIVFNLSAMWRQISVFYMLSTMLMCFQIGPYILPVRKTNPAEICLLKKIYIFLLLLTKVINPHSQISSRGYACSPCSDKLRLFRRQKGVQLNSWTVWLIFCTLSVYTTHFSCFTKYIFHFWISYPNVFIWAQWMNNV